MSFGSMLHGLTEARVRFVVVGGVAAAAHGSTFVTNDLDVCYDAVATNVDRLAALLREWRAYPRGVEQFHITPVMTLSTREGEIDVLDRVDGVGDYRVVYERSVALRAFDVRFRVLDLAALIAAKRAAGRPKDIAQLPELEALLALRAN
jgi:hypothetical protein